LQGTNGHANQLGDLLLALSSLDEIPDLLDSYRTKLYQPSSRELRGKSLGLQHWFILSAHCYRRPLPSASPRLANPSLSGGILCMNALGSGRTRSGDQSSLDWLPGALTRCLFSVYFCPPVKQQIWQSH
jgi:hypothetical protein